MVAPSPGSSRGPTPTPTAPSTHASASSSRASHAASKLDPRSASFSYLQNSAMHGRAQPTAPVPAQPLPYPPFSPPPPPPSRGNGLYGMPVGYSPYPISAANGMPTAGPSSSSPGPTAPWNMPRNGGGGGWGAGPNGYPPNAAPSPQPLMHQAAPQHPSQSPYYPHAPLHPPAQTRMPPPVPPPTANGIMLPLSPPPHLSATMAAAGYPMPMSSLPAPAAAGVPGVPGVPHPGLLPPFSPQRPLPPSAVAAPRLVPAPSLPVSPSTPLPPQSVSPAPPRPVSAVPMSPKAGKPDAAPPAFGDATSPPPAASASAPQIAHGPRGYGIRRRKDHLPSPRNAEALSFAPNLRIPREYQGMFRTPSSLGSPVSANTRRSRATASLSPSRSKAPVAAAPVPVPSSLSVASPTQPAAGSPQPESDVSSSTRTPAPASNEPPPVASTEGAGPVEADKAQPDATSSSAAPSAPAVPPAPESAPTSPPTSPRPPQSSIKRSWADLVRPPGGSQAKGVNGVQPISATIGGDLTAAPRAADTLLSLLARAPPHEHSPHAPTARGLINNGNLCFANSTLQALVYCGSFWNLMNTVERTTRKDLREAMAGAADKNASERSAVEATIAFLAEFRGDEAPTAAFDPILNRKSGAASSASGTTTPKPPYNNNSHPAPSSPSVSTPSQPGPLSPTPIHEALRHNPRFDAMRRGTQEDAEEFLGFFLETLHEEILKLVEAEEELEAKRKGKRTAPAAGGDDGWEEVGSKGRVATTRTTATKESPITCIFGGKLRSVLKCPGQKDSVTIEPFQRLQLDIQPDHVLSIEDALLHLTTPESLPDFMSSRGIRTQEASKQVFVDALPPVLLLHLKRFLYDEVGGVQKSTKKVAYGTELSIDERVMSAPLRAQVGKDGARYELFGVVYHHGLYASGGHYTVAARRGYHSSSWLELDDTHMRPLTADEVAVSISGTNRRWESTADGRRRFDEDDGDQKQAYLLLYTRSS